MRALRPFAVLVAAALGVVTGAAAQSTLLVPEEHPTIQAALEQAVDGDTVLVGPGVYVESIDFLDKDVEVRSRFGPAATVIDADRQGRVVRITGPPGATPTLEGFTVRGGLAQMGAGIFGAGAAVTVRRCVVTDNWATITGGGMHFPTGGPTVVACVVTGNYGAAAGGGMFFDWSSGPVTVTNCTVMGNRLEEFGQGAGIVMHDPDTVVSNCIVRENRDRAWTPAPFFPHPDVTVQYSTYEFASSSLGPGNFDLDPLCVSLANGDVHLTTGSPCRAAGLASAPAVPETDFEGDFLDLAAVDVGADAFHPHLYHVGDVAEGATVHFRVAGAPVGTTCTAWLTNRLLPTPVTTQFGDFHLADRRLQLFAGATIGPEGWLDAPLALPSTLPGPLTLYAQALIGAELSPLHVLHGP